MQYVIYIAAGIVLLGLCIFIHELGHLLGGRMVGIKAKTFSIGMGKGIVKKKIGDTTYQIAPFPFGGYCQFYGEDPSEERTGQGFEFLSAHPLRRIVTVAMGPLFNLFFGIIIFFVMNLVGYSKDTNQVNIPEQLRTGKQTSPAYEAGVRSGDRVVKIGDEEIKSFSDLQAAVMFSEGKTLEVTLERGSKLLRLQVTPRQAAGGRYEIGVMPYGTHILIVDMMDGGVAQAAGLRVMDEIVSVDGIEMQSEAEFSRYINERANRPVKLSFMRKDVRMEKVVTPALNEIVRFQALDGRGAPGESFPIMKSDSLQRFFDKGQIKINERVVTGYDDLLATVREANGGRVSLKVDNEKYSGIMKIEKVGLIGIFQAMAPDQVLIRYGVADAFIHSFVEPYEFIVMNLKGIGMLFTGKMNVRENLSGPIRIVQIAGQVAYYKGIPDFILLMAKISIILMVMNLLPIPVVDGSHLIFFTIEWIRKKPLSQKIMERIQTVGIVILVMLMAFVIINDISMLPFMKDLFK